MNFTPDFNPAPPVEIRHQIAQLPKHCLVAVLTDDADIWVAGAEDPFLVPIDPEHVDLGPNPTWPSPDDINDLILAAVKRRLVKIMEQTA